MASRQLLLPHPLDDLWRAFQQLETWHGLGGLDELDNGRWNRAGELIGFDFSIGTPLGRIRDSASVEPQKPSLRAEADSKGVRIEVHLHLAVAHVAGGDHTAIDFSIDAKATSLLTRPLQGTLRATFESGIDRERDRLSERLSQPQT